MLLLGFLGYAAEQGSACTAGQCEEGCGELFCRAWRPHLEFCLFIMLMFEI